MSTTSIATAASVLSPTKAKVGPLWEEVGCNLCGSENFKVKYRGTTDQDMSKMLRSYSASGNFISEETLVECRDCKLVFTSPRLKKDLILKSYMEEEDPAYVSQADGRIKSFERCLDAVEKHRKSGNILDIGAAAGFFLKVAKDRGWKTFGIEPSKYLSAFGNKEYGLSIKQGTIESQGQFDEKMDVITLWDVLEHTFNPTDVLKRCHRMLKDDGLVVINYPNIGNWMAKMAGRKWWFIISVHLYYFTPKTMKKMLEACGYEVVESSPHFQWLDLGYLIYRGEAYFPKMAKFAGWIAKKIGIHKSLVPYYASQTRVVARKAVTK